MHGMTIREKKAMNLNGKRYMGGFAGKTGKKKESTYL